MERLHTTPSGAERVRRSLCLPEVDVTAWRRARIVDPRAAIVRQGKNGHVTIDGCVLTVNAPSLTIITAQRIPARKRASEDAAGTPRIEGPVG